MSASPTPHQPPIHTDVVVVGNGPSAIALSFLLSGQRPFYNGGYVANEFLEERLRAALDTPITEQDLELLSEGLEGRSTNPVALLLDSLCHPDADLGGDHPPALDWHKDERFAFRHVVLGKGLPGGAWQKMDGSMQTISQNSWMELPTLPFRDWLHKRRSAQPSGKPGKNRRATVMEVKQYYQDFVETRGLSGNFRNHHTVTSVQKVFQLRSLGAVDSENGEQEPCCQNIKQNHAFLWEVRGHWLDEAGGRGEFCYVAPRVVLATGAYDIPNRLCLPGESLPHVLHSLAEFEQHVQRGDVGPASEPVLVVGAGLSAADAILLAQEAEVPVIHVFRVRPNDPGLVFRKLPPSIYPEYHRVHSLMQGGESPDSALYRSFPQHRLVEICSDGKVLLQPTLPPTQGGCLGGEGGDQEGSAAPVLQTVECSLVVVLIGSRPNLSFLPHEGRHLGVVQDWCVDSKHNPVAVDPFSFQSQAEPGLFAMGPLVGDNFVRFGVGGALGIASYLAKTRCKQHQ